MKEKKLIPKRRFKEFENDGAWEERKLFEVAEFNPKSELPDVFEYIDLESVVGTEMISHRTETKSSAPSRAQRLARNGDVFYQTVRPYQKNNYLFIKSDNNYVFSTGYAQMRPNIDTTFLMSFLQTEGFLKVVLDNCTGTSYPAINSTDLSNLEISLPISRDEQRKVGEIFINIDNLIALHQRKLKKLKQTKLAYLSEMFPKEGEKYPKRRFDGFTEPWKECRLEDLCELFTDGDWIETKDQSTEGIRLIQTGNIGVTRYLDKPNNAKWISEDAFDRLNCKEIFSGDILISRLPEPAGRACIIPYTPNRMITAVDCTIVRVKPDIDNKYLVQYLATNKYFNEVKIGLAGGTRQRISRSNLANFRIAIPKNNLEQKKIGRLFESLDNLTTLHQQKLEKLENLKKAYLNEMFV